MTIVAQLEDAVQFSEKKLKLSVAQTVRFIKNLSRIPNNTNVLGHVIFASNTARFPANFSHPKIILDLMIDRAKCMKQIFGTFSKFKSNRDFKTLQMYEKRLRNSHQETKSSLCGSDSSTQVAK